MFKKIALVIFLTFLANFAHASSVDVDVNGLVCEFCAVTIEKNFNKQSEVANVTVDLEEAKVFIDFKDGENLSDEEITNIIKDNGYNVVKINR